VRDRSIFVKARYFPGTSSERDYDGPLTESGKRKRMNPTQVLDSANNPEH
jgi:hypothetical protein